MALFQETANEDFLSTFGDCAYEDNLKADFFSADMFPQEEEPNLLDTLPCLFEPSIEIPEVTISAVDDYADLYEYNPKRTINRKRKSEDWNFKPEPKVLKPFAKSETQIFVDAELEQCADMFFDLLLSTKKQKVASSEPAEVPRATTKRRPRWSNKEVKDIWTGIEKYGNNWKEIKDNFLKDRTYYQVKDKARRVLANEGWVSGDADASKKAKKISKRVNKRLAKSR